MLQKHLDPNEWFSARQLWMSRFYDLDKPLTSLTTKWCSIFDPTTKESRTFYMFSRLEDTPNGGSMKFLRVIYEGHEIAEHQIEFDDHHRFVAIRI